MRGAVEAARQAQRERQLLRDMLAMVTEGKLQLCDSARQLPSWNCQQQYGPIRLTKSEGLSELGKIVRSTAKALGFADERIHDIATAASEAGMNAIVSGGGSGEAHVAACDGVVQVRVEDH